MKSETTSLSLIVEKGAQSSPKELVDVNEITT